MSSDVTPRSAPKRILIVEDNELNMKLLNDVLEAYGYEIVKTGSGAAVLDLARQHRPDLVLMDIRLPGTDGLEALQNGDVLRPVGRCGLGHAGRPFGVESTSVDRAVERGWLRHKTAGQRPEYHLCKSTREGCHFRRRRTSTRSTTPSPKASRNRPTNSLSR